MSNRKSAESLCLEYIDKILPGSNNREIYQKFFEAMDDQAFENFIKRLEDKSAHLALYAPNMKKPSLSTERNLKIGKELNHSFFERLIMPARDGAPSYVTPEKYLVVLLPLRRQAQLQIKKISIPENNRNVDNLTGQPVGESKGSKISYPELQILAALGLDRSITELIKYRGGDQKGFMAMNNQIARTGGVSQDALSELGTKVKVTSTLATYLTGMHIQSTLNQ